MTKKCSRPSAWTWAASSGANAYSYLFDGQLGHLDYGFASAALLPQVTGADAWHINADEVDLFDYNDEIFDSPQVPGAGGAGLAGGLRLVALG